LPASGYRFYVLFVTGTLKEDELLVGVQIFAENGLWQQQRKSLAGAQQKFFAAVARSDRSDGRAELTGKSATNAQKEQQREVLATAERNHRLSERCVELCGLGKQYMRQIQALLQEAEAIALTAAAAAPAVVARAQKKVDENVALVNLLLREAQTEEGVRVVEAMPEQKVCFCDQEIPMDVPFDLGDHQLQCETRGTLAVALKELTATASAAGATSDDVLATGRDLCSRMTDTNLGARISWFLSDTGFLAAQRQNGGICSVLTGASAAQTFVLVCVLFELATAVYEAACDATMTSTLLVTTIRAVMPGISRSNSQAKAAFDQVRAHSDYRHTTPLLTGYQDPVSGKSVLVNSTLPIAPATYEKLCLAADKATLTLLGFEYGPAVAWPTEVLTLGVPAWDLPGAGAPPPNLFLSQNGITQSVYAMREFATGISVQEAKEAAGRGFLLESPKLSSAAGVALKKTELVVRLKKLAGARQRACLRTVEYATAEAIAKSLVNLEQERTFFLRRQLALLEPDELARIGEQMCLADEVSRITGAITTQLVFCARDSEILEEARRKARG
jgi:hypothetical protein